VEKEQIINPPCLGAQTVEWVVFSSSKSWLFTEVLIRLKEVVTGVIVVDLD
jgi:hypothetical protein